MDALADVMADDYRSGSEGASAERRGELFRHVTALLVLVVDRCLQEHLDVYDAVPVRLADMVAPPMRGEAAHRLAGLGRAPAGIVRRLALDDIEVAAPLLGHSTALDENDLVAIACSRGEPHRLAIAARSGLSARVAETLVVHGDDPVRRAVAGNRSAAISARAFHCLYDQARRDPVLRRLLAARDDVPRLLLTH
ncbi:DUF2336 domain-containing protein [Prosthecomicrobium pneumaticum]|uniref:Uncharacterized protein (DUF2336 family) n=1 Tax=Prosthecomicrobium pneumaticum TaxID=81895 RepID=A0A7W9FLQ8_9HYPH|nr:DUF2336 domain-containing protein [Prosthecomicrobium pneumaticum]MBB5752984.1 uncharacterized protein (DUF2336 family) [Prosthecomicrobium pneumaticum]